LTAHPKQQDCSRATVVLQIRESDDPLLLGNKVLRIRPSDYVARVKLLRPHGLRKKADRRRKVVLESQIAYLLVRDLLEKAGWKIIPHSMGHGTHPLMNDPVEFIEKIQRRQLSDEFRTFLSRRHTGIPGTRLKCDLLIADKRRFALLEIKSTMKDSSAFPLNSLGQLFFYLRAAELGILVKFVHVKFLDSWSMVLACFPEGELVGSGAISPMAYARPTDYEIFLKLLILKYLAASPPADPATINSGLDDFRVRVGWRLEGLFEDGLVRRVSEASYCPKCGKQIPYCRLVCPLCSALLSDSSTYTITEEGLKELNASVRLLRSHHEFVSKRFLTLFNDI